MNFRRFRHIFKKLLQFGILYNAEQYFFEEEKWWPPKPIEKLKLIPGKKAS